MDTVNEYYTTGEVATLFRTSKQAVRRWIRNKLIAAVKSPSGKPLIHRDEVQRFTERSAPTPGESPAAVEKRLGKLADSLQKKPAPSRKKHATV